MSKLEPLVNPFWQFSLAVYRDSAVQEHCLQLQHDYNANVNLLLFCCWLAYAVAPLAKHEVINACEVVSFWHENITCTLRKIRLNRHDLSQQSTWQQQFFKQILADELLSESWQQQILFQQVQHKQIAMPIANKERAYSYLSWLFLALDKPIDTALSRQLYQFISLVYLSVPDQLH